MESVFGSADTEDDWDYCEEEVEKERRSFY